MGNNELKIFENSEFGKLNVLVIDGKEYFPATECAKILGYSDTDQAIRKNCRYPSRRRVPHPQSKDKTIEKNFIPESDLYRLIIKSKLPSAERFEKWVMEEVLPSIRKHGGYLYGQEQMTDEEMLCASLLFAQKKIEDRDRKIASLEKEKALLTKEVLTWQDEPLLNALVRKYAHEACGGNFACGWKSLFKELLYQHGINLESRKAQFKLHNPDKGAGATYKFLKQSEMPLAFSSITALCEKQGVDISALLEKKAG
jgi:prophage antirepressor-like protein